MCWAAETPITTAETGDRWFNKPKPSVPQVPVPPPMTAKQQAYARAEQARLAKEKRRNAAP